MLNTAMGTRENPTDLRTKARHLTEETTHAAAEYSDRAKSWIENNYGKTLGLVGFLAAVGTIGYFIGRNNYRVKGDSIL